MMIPQAIKKDIVKVYFSCEDVTEPTPTYAPAMFENVNDFAKTLFNFGKQTARVIRDLAIQFAILNICPFYLQALKDCREKRRAGTIPKELPLSFKDASAPAQIKLLCEHSAINTAFNILEFNVPTIDNMGTVKVGQAQPTKELSVSPTFTPGFEQTVIQSQIPTVEAEKPVSSATGIKPLQ